MIFLRGILDRIILVAGVVASGCIPSFIAQYRQRLGGHLEQVLKDLEPFQQIADLYHHGSLQELIRHHLNSPDRTFHDEGAAVQAMVTSAEELSREVQSLETDLFHQMGYLLTGGLDTNIAAETWAIFVPSFNLSAESIVFATVTGIAIWLAFLLTWYSVGRFITVITARTPDQTPK